MKNWTVLCAAFAALAFMAGCGDSSAPTDAAAAANLAPPKQDKDGIFHTSSGLQYQIMQVGRGAEATAGHVVSVAYKGTLTDGTIFDASPMGQPFQFPLGDGHVIKGWDEGIAGMKVGESRILTIPPELGYGDRGAGKIPPNATLIFQVELMDVR